MSAISSYKCNSVLKIESEWTKLHDKAFFRHMVYGLLKPFYKQLFSNLK